MVGNKLGIYDGEVPGSSLRAAHRRKLGGDKVSGTGLSGGYFECAWVVNIEYGSEELGESAL